MTLEMTGQEFLAWFIVMALTCSTFVACYDMLLKWMAKK